jgi:hypothetical protein
MNNILENGLILLQHSPNKAVDLSGGRFHGWLFYQHPDGQYVTERKLENCEIMQAEDQRDYGIVIDGSATTPNAAFSGHPQGD